MDSKSKPNHRRSPSYDRFLDPPKFISSGAGDELNEDDVFWTGDFSEARSTSSDLEDHKHRHAFKEEEDRSGILAALSDNRKPNRPVLYRKTSTSRIIPAIPKPKPPQEREREYSQSMPPPPVRKFQQSAPVNVPMMMQRRKGGALADVDLDLDDEEEEMLPPHEIVARGSGNPTITTSSSVLEGVGRTLKGRDLRLVRNAVWRQTGFLD